MIPPLKITGLFGCPRAMYAIINMPETMHIQGFLTNQGPMYSISNKYNGQGLFGEDFITEQQLNAFIKSWNRKEKLKNINAKL